jgi:8-oxo-dGTP diphosphatase
MPKSERDFLASYDDGRFKKPSVAVDVVIFTVFEGDLHVLTIKRAEHPFLGRWSLVGGYVDVDKDSDLEASAKRKLEEKTSVRTPYLEQLITVGDGRRDPRGWTVTTVYFALLPVDKIRLRQGGSASDIEWTKVFGAGIKKKLAFDHTKLLELALERLRSKVLYTALPLYLMPPEFTLNELKTVFDLILGNEIDGKSFRRRILGAEMIEETGASKISGKRPAKLYRIRKGFESHFFVRNLEGSL